MIHRALTIEDTEDDGENDTSGKRCKCGLRLPCNSCLTSFRPVGAGPVLPAPQADFDSNEISEACDRFIERRNADRV